MKTWDFDNYLVYEETDVLRFENNEGDTIGYVHLHHDDADILIGLLNDGINPIEDEWEDGIGNTIDINGWGNEKLKGGAKQ